MRPTLGPVAGRWAGSAALAVLAVSSIWVLLAAPSMLHDGAFTAQTTSFPRWWFALLAGEWGVSRRTGEAILEALAWRAPMTVLVGLASAGVAVMFTFVSLPFVATDTNGILGGVLRRVALALRGTPAFLLAMALVSLFSYYFNWLPAVVLEVSLEHLTEMGRALAMPVLTLGALYWARLLPWVLATRQQGAARAIFRYGASGFVWALGALLIVDAVFALPGLGRWLAASARFADVAVVQGVAIVCLASAALIRACSRGRPVGPVHDPCAGVPSPVVLARLWLALAWLTVVVAGSAFADWLPLHDPNAIDLGYSHAPPDARHWWGTDALGRDMLALMAHGGSVSVYTACAAALLGLVFAGFVSLMRNSDRRVVQWVGATVDDYLRLWSPVVVMMLLALIGWPGGYATLAVALALLGAPRCVDATAALGLDITRQSNWAYAFVLSAEAVRIFALSLGLIAVFGFLRLAPPADIANWGAAIAQGREHLGYAPAMVWVPAVVLWLTLLACQQISETLRGGQRAALNRRVS